MLVSYVLLSNEIDVSLLSISIILCETRNILLGTPLRADNSRKKILIFVAASLIISSRILISHFYNVLYILFKTQVHKIKANHKSV